jgi:hypothetical protein
VAEQVLDAAQVDSTTADELAHGWAACMRGNFSASPHRVFEYTARDGGALLRSVARAPSVSPRGLLASRKRLQL